MASMSVRPLPWRVGQLADALAPVGGRCVAERGLFGGGVYQLAQRGQEGEFERGLWLLDLRERGQTCVAPLGRRRDPLRQIEKRFKPNLSRRRKVARERSRLCEPG